MDTFTRAQRQRSQSLKMNVAGGEQGCKAEDEAEAEAEEEAEEEAEVVGIRPWSVCLRLESLCKRSRTVHLELEYYNPFHSRDKDGFLQLSTSTRGSTVHSSCTCQCSLHPVW